MIIRVKKCRACGREFETSTRAQYCSEECRELGNKEYHRQYQRTVKGYERENKPDRQRPLMEMYERICPQCGVKFRTCKYNKIYCSRKCKDWWFVTPENLRMDQRIPEIRERVQRERAERNVTNKVALERLRLEKEERERKAAEKKRLEQLKKDRIKRTETGAVWYPVSGAEIQRIARETHRSYGEVCAEFLSKQVRVGEQEHGS